MRVAARRNFHGVLGTFDHRDSGETSGINEVEVWCFKQCKADEAGPVQTPFEKRGGELAG